MTGDPEAGADRVPIPETEGAVSSHQRSILERVAEIASVAIVHLDRGGQVLYCNPIAQRLLGVSDASEGRRRYDAPEWRITDLDGNPLLVEDLPFSKVMSSGETVRDLCHAIETPDGRRVVLRINAAPLLEPGGAIEGVVASLEDITAQVAVERSLADRVGFEKLLLEATNRLLAVGRDEVDAAIRQALGDVAESVGASCAVIGRRDAEPRTRPATLDWHASDVRPSKTQTLNALSRILDGSPAGPVATPWLVRKLDELPAGSESLRAALETAGIKAVAAVPLRYRDRQIGVLGVAATREAVGWTEETLTLLAMSANSLAAALAGKVAEEALVRSEERAERLVAASPMGIHMYDLMSDGRLVFAGANPAADRILGIENQAFVGKTIEDAFPPLSETEVPERYRRAAALGESWETQQIHYRDNAIAGAFQVFAFQTRPGAMAALFLDVTARLQSEEALRQSENRLKSILGVAPAGIGLVRRRVFQEVNERICEMTGYSPQELLGQSARMLYPTQEEFELVGREKYRQIEAGGFGSVETVWRRKDGGVRDVLLSSAPLDASDLDLGVTFTALDITDRKFNERLTQTQLDLLRSASGHLDLVETLTLCLDAVLELGGLDAGGVYLLDRDDGSLRLVCDRGLSLDFVRQIGTVGAGDPRHTLVKLGEPRYLRSQDLPALGGVESSDGLRCLAVVPLLDHGDVVGCLNVGSRSKEMVTEHARIALETVASLAGGIVARVEAEEALRRSEAKQREFLRNFQGIVYLAELPGYRLMLLDGLVREITGYSREAFLAEGMAWADLVHPDDRMHWQASMDALERPGGPVSADVEYRIVHQDGGVRWVRDVAHCLVGELGATGGIHGAVYDVSERRRAEQAQRDLEAQIRQQQRLESIGTLAAGVAHEVNNPLNGILNYGQLIANRSDPESPIHRWALNIVRESDRVSEIVRNLLAFSRHEKQAHSPARMDDVVGATLTLVSALFRKDQISIRSEIPAELPSVKCRSQQIQQVLLNLLTNARDALNERFPDSDPQKTIEITSEAIDRDGQQWLRTTVVDHGVGIPPTIAERLFDPFFTTKPRDAGTGLGLAVSYGIVKAHHGTLTFESEPGTGTTFVLDLPVDNGWELGEG